MKIWLQSLLAVLLAGHFLAAAEGPGGQGVVDPRRPGAIDAREVPVVPAEIFAKLAQYQSVRGAAFRGWAPDGTGILINTRFGNSSQLHRVYEPAGRREQITFYNEPVSGMFIPQATDGAILMTMDSGGNENDQVYLFDRRKFETRLLTDGKSRNQLGAIRDNGSQVVISSNQRNGRDSDLYLADPRKPDSMVLLMQVEKQTWQAYDWSRDGKFILLSRYVSANESYPALLNVATGERTDLPLATDEKASVGPMAIAPDGKSILIATDGGSEFNRLARFDLATRKYEWLTADIPWNVSDIEIHADSGQVAFAVNDDGATRLFLLPNEHAPRRDLKLPLGIVSGMRFSPDGKRLGFTLARADLPPDAFSMQLDTGELTRWTYSEVGGLNPENFVTPSRIQFKSFDGRMIPAYYFQPRTAVAATSSAARLPVLISIHGGPESQYQPFFSPIFQYYVNELGIAVICPNVRGSSGYGKTYLKLDNAEKREDSVKDIGALLDWIAQQPELDASRVAVAGGSYGGYMTLASLTHFGDRIRAGIDVVGIANFITFLEKTAGYRVDLRRAEYGDERDPQMKAIFEKISPLNNADKILASLMVVHGKNDPRVPFFEAEQIAARVRQNGKSVWTVFANNEGHGFAKKDNVDYERAVEVLFLMKHLGLGQ
ncbi:S9 family peptidase [Schlesneria paludicola]|uniref:S9 family peptidase n=1 Tax=Schlesneria paludicola TaxID=360056 RepID=UPI00029A8079|nr:S9 family peptidase [Schlesneria paludicola]